MCGGGVCSYAGVQHQHTSQCEGVRRSGLGKGGCKSRFFYRCRVAQLRWFLFPAMAAELIQHPVLQVLQCSGHLLYPSPTILARPELLNSPPRRRMCLLTRCLPPPDIPSIQSAQHRPRPLPPCYPLPISPDISAMGSVYTPLAKSDLELGDESLP